MVNNTEADVQTHADERAKAPFTENREGGRQAWFAVAGSFLVFFSSFGVLNSFEFFQNFYRK
jgi:MFS transporter, MCT family, solute carrier family 16 (monocarboxylic acid transporters), member 10